ncbi:MAG: Fe-S cluster assembly protein SufD [Acidobacteria bacterium]|nr:Fe-S cluster assembly protein SufD [Acidobacteriota bacterium]
MEQHETYLASFRQREAALARRDPGWLTEMRREAIESFADLGFPTVSDEEWRYTNVAPITRTPFQAARPGSIHCAIELIEATYWKEPVAARLVFINGHYSPQFSVLSNVARGLEVVNLAAAMGNGRAASDGWLHTFLGRSAGYRRHPFTALNTAFWEDGAYVRIPKGIVVAEPIHLVFVSAAGEEPLVSYPRTLVIAERETQATVMESFVGLEGGVCFSNSVSEIVAAENAKVDHYQLQRENARSYHVGMLHVYQGRSAQFSSNAAALGGALVRNEVSVVLDAEGAECALNGLYLAGGKQHVDNHTSIEHARPHGSSRQLYHGILDGEASAVFNGRIVVQPDAQKTDAIQKNRNLLLSADATIDTKPELVIFADDVRCTHGATIGQMDPEALFYLCSRGIAREQARELLVYAFAAEILDKMKPRAVRAWAESVLRSRLSS